MGFLETLNQHPIPETICLVAHSLCAVLVIQHVNKFRQLYPYRQNSPSLVILSQLALIFASLTLVISKCIAFNPSNPSFQDCYSDNDLMAYLNLIYIFSMQFIVATCLIRLRRVSLVYQNSCFAQAQFRICSKERNMVIFSISYALLISLIDYILKWHVKSTFKHLSLYPQTQSFMCQGVGKNQSQVLLQVFIFVKMAFESIIFIFVFIQSGRIEKANKELDFRAQFFIIFILIVSVVLTRLICFFIDTTWNVALILHYVDCLSNLLCGMFLMRTYVGDGNHKEFYLPTYYPQVVSDLEYLLSKTDSRSAIVGYFCREDHGKRLLSIFNNNDTVRFDKISEEELRGRIQEMREIINLIEGPQNAQFFENSSICDDGPVIEADYLRTYINRMCNKRLRQWKGTKSHDYLKQKWEENAKREKKMIQLGLMDSDWLRISDDFIYS